MTNKNKPHRTSAGRLSAFAFMGSFEGGETNMAETKVKRSSGVKTAQTAKEKVAIKEKYMKM